jgi:hypothetical protein
VFGVLLLYSSRVEAIEQKQPEIGCKESTSVLHSCEAGTIRVDCLLSSVLVFVFFRCSETNLEVDAGDENMQEINIWLPKPSCKDVFYSVT